MLNVTVPDGADSKALKQAIEDAALKKTKLKLRGIRCSVHEKVPRPVVKAGVIQVGNLCCAAMRKRVVRALGRG